MQDSNAKHTHAGREKLEDTLQAHGLTLTVQRRAIFESLEGRTDHPTADMVFESVQSKMPGVSRPTVYRVLDTFVQVGLVRKVKHPGSAARFDPRTDRHHHFVCSSCGEVADVELASDRRVPVPSVHDCGFEIDDFSIHFTGRCEECR